MAESKELQLELDTSDNKAKIWDNLRCKKEQNSLSGYFEAKIRDIDKSHIEHIEAKSRNY